MARDAELLAFLIPAALVGLVVLSPGAGEATTSPGDRARIKRALAELGWPEPEVDRVIQIESGWRPSAWNKQSDASGLIQFTPPNLAKYGFRPELPAKERAAAFRRLTALGQLPYILAFFRPMKWRKPGDTYLAVAASGHVGAPDDRVIYPVNTKAWQQNPAWRPSDGGAITAGSIRALLLRRLA